MFLKHIRELIYRTHTCYFLVGFLSLLWFILRTGTKPSRAVYPCQKTAAANGYLWLTIYFFPLLSFLPYKFTRLPTYFDKKKVAFIVFAVLIGGTIAYWRFSEIWKQNTPLELTINQNMATSQPASDIFIVKGTQGNDNGIQKLIDLMNQNGIPFYKSIETGENKGPKGLVGMDDVLIIKVNSQWNKRGGTNTDLLRALIQAIVDHPDGFIGEIIVADNGQAQYGSTQVGGSLNYNENNAEDISQSVQKIVDYFTESYEVSTYLWDTITTNRVNEYSKGDMEDGYIINTTINQKTGIMVSYPKFKTEYDTYISFKLGIWDPQEQTYDSERLKVINMPVLKSHGGYGVTACVKHYMGVVSDKLTAQLGARAHDTIGSGGMGTEMAQTRFPVLNILDAIWINAIPNNGPETSYYTAVKVDVVAASTDPVALDYWSAKYVLMQAAITKGYGEVSSMDPDNTFAGSFGDWLETSMQEIIEAGFKATKDETCLNVYVVDNSN